MIKPRISMKMLWELRGDFGLEEANDRTKSQREAEDAMEYTRRFLFFVESHISTKKKS